MSQAYIEHLKKVEKAGGYAFPHNELEDDGTVHVVHPGLTVRDLVAIEVAPVLYVELMAKLRREGVGLVDDAYKVASMAAYQFAEAMLEARNSAPAEPRSNSSVDAFYRTEALKAGYVVGPAPNGRCKIENGLNLPVPVDPVLDIPITFETEGQAWLAAWMFSLGLREGRK